MIREIKRALTIMDNYVFDHVQTLVSETNTHIMVILSFFASHSFLLPANIVLVAGLLFIQKDRWKAIKVVVVSLGSVLLMFSLKFYFRRVRPVHPVHEAASGYSFPSGHAMSAMTFYGLIIYFLWMAIKNKQVRWLFFIFLSLLILAIGFSRIYLRVHYTSDVLGGFLFGLLWLQVSLWVVNRFEQKSMYEKTI